MNKLLVLIALLVASPSWAKPFDDAVAANARGDYATALRILRSLAAQGEAGAQTWLGDMYFTGEGVAEDYAQAVKWYKLAAAQGDSLSQWQLGDIYASGGEGVAQDYAEAVKWYKLAAAQGYSLAQWGISALYLGGKGVAQDYVRAHMWANLAAVSGGKGVTKFRNDIAKLMTPQQIAEAQKLARECQARQFKNCD